MPDTFKFVKLDNTKSARMNTYFVRILFIYAFLIFTCVPVSTMAQNSAGPGQATSFENLNVSAFKKELSKQKGILLDVRTPEEYAKGHLPNAININYLSPDFKQALKELKPDQPYFIYCAVGGRSAKACTQLKNIGFKKVYNLEEGIMAWQKSGQEIIK